MSQPAPSVPPSAVADTTLLFVEPVAVITEADVVLDEDAWRALLIQIDREEGGP